MTNFVLFQHASLGGTGATDLINSGGDSSTLADAGDTLSFNGSTTTLDFDPNEVLDDAGNTDALLATGTVNGVTVAPGDHVEYNYTLVLEDPTTGYFHRVDVFAFDLDDGNKAFFVSQAWDPIAQEYVTGQDGKYAGQELKILDAGDLTSGNTVSGASFSLNDPELNEFARGDGTLTLAPHNNDAEAGTIEDIQFVCFGGDTMIDTEEGLRPADTLEVGDVVRTADNGSRPIRWIGRRSLDQRALRYAPSLRPVRIRAGALGRGAPVADTLVSQQHRVLVANKVAERMFGASEILVAAKFLLDLDGVEIAEDIIEITYVHFACDAHEIVYANGAPMETLLPGPTALSMLPEDARAELLTLFPKLVNAESGLNPARALVRGGRARRMATRMATNSRAALEEARLPS